MNLKDEVVNWPKRFTPIKKPYYVVRCDDHFMVCTLDKEFNLLTEESVIHWNPYTVRRWALIMSKAVKNPRTKKRRKRTNHVKDWAEIMETIDLTGHKG